MPVKITWLGHAAFLLYFDKPDTVVVIDPWLKGNPTAPYGPDRIERADLVLVTHDHGDHLGDAVTIAKRTGAKVPVVYELANRLKGVDTVGMNVGGSFEHKGVRVTLVPAIHSCEAGTPVGYVVSDGEVTVYHAGDTGFTKEFEAVRDLFHPDVALLPIGGTFTMDEEQAAKAAEVLGVKLVVPMHYNTFPVIKADPSKLKQLLEPKGIRVSILKPGETVTYP